MSAAGYRFQTWPTYLREKRQQRMERSREAILRAKRRPENQLSILEERKALMKGGMSAYEANEHILITARFQL